MYSKSLYNLFLIFFLAAVIFIYFNRVFMILCAHRAQLCGKIRLFCCISLFLRNYLFRMRLFAAGWAPCGRDGRFAAHGSRFLRRDGYTAPLQTVCGVCGGGCVFGGLHARQRDAVLPLQRGAGLLQICHSLFVPPAPPLIPGFPLPISLCASS